MDRGRDAGIAVGGMPRQADDARVKPGPAPRHGLILPSSLLPLLLLFLGACGVRAEKAGPLTRRDDEDAGPQDTVAPPSADADLTPQARANLIRMCLKALSENTLQQSAIDDCVPYRPRAREPRSYRQHERRHLGGPTPEGRVTDPAGGSTAPAGVLRFT